MSAGRIDLDNLDARSCLVNEMNNKNGRANVVTRSFYSCSSLHRSSKTLFDVGQREFMWNGRWRWSIIVVDVSTEHDARQFNTLFSPSIRSSNADEFVAGVSCDHDQWHVASEWVTEGKPSATSIDLILVVAVSVISIVNAVVAKSAANVIVAIDPFQQFAEQWRNISK